MNRPPPHSFSSNSSSTTFTTSTLSTQPTPRRKSKSPNSNTTHRNGSGNGPSPKHLSHHRHHLATPGAATKTPRAPTTTTTTTTTTTNSSISSPGLNWGVQWSTLQSLAGTVLGSDVLGNDTESTVKQRRQRPIDSSTAPTTTNHSSSSSSWFSSATGETPTDRGSMRPRGRRRADPANGSDLASGSARRNVYKRATSPDPEDAMEAVDMEGAKDILVYVHQVKPTDTMEGVVIAFNIPPGALRKANGMWSHDSVQSRRTLLLPIDECQVKGKLVDLLGPTSENETAQQVEIEGMKTGATSEEPAQGEETPYKHESYVTIEGIGQVEIARLARNKLSHFPPRRRKGTSTRRLSGFGDLPNTSSLLDQSSLLDLLEEPSSPTNVFRGMTPGVGELHPQYNQNSHNLGSVKTGFGPGPGAALGPETFTLRTLGEMANDTAVGLENIGGVVEGFVRKWTAKAQDFVGGDLIELTQRLGFEIEEEGESRGGEAMSRGGSVGSSGSSSSRGTVAGMENGGSGSARDGGSKVVRERLTRREVGGEYDRDGERSKAL